MGGKKYNTAMEYFLAHVAEEKLVAFVNGTCTTGGEVGNGITGRIAAEKRKRNASDC